MCHYPAIKIFRTFVRCAKFQLELGTYCIHSVCKTLNSIRLTSFWIAFHILLSTHISKFNKLLKILFPYLRIIFTKWFRISRSPTYTQEKYSIHSINHNHRVVFPNQTLHTLVNEFYLGIRILLLAGSKDGDGIRTVMATGNQWNRYKLQQLVIKTFYWSINRLLHNRVTFFG